MSLLENISFYRATVRVAVCLIIMFNTGWKIYAQPGKTSLIHTLDSLAGKEYKFFLENNEKGNYNQALEHLQHYADISDSITRLKRIDQLAEINGRYENDKKAYEMNLLIQDNKLKDLQINRNRFVIFGVSGVCLLVWMIIVMIIRQRRLRTNQQALALEQSLLRSQMNPHFIFNTLTNIQSFILRKDTGLSLKYLDNFSTLIGTILASTGKKAIALETELTTISNYFKLQQLRFGDKLGFEIMVDESLDQSTILLPPMMIQPLIENAIEHGIKPKEGPGRVDVRFKKLETGLMIEVEDNGVGRGYKKEDESNNSHHAGLALVILKERLEALKTGRFEILDLLDADGNGCGTIARLFLPLMKI
jgi:hypothetical protein